MNDKCKIHKAFDRQIQLFGGTTLSNYFKDLILKGIRTHEGEVSVLHFNIQSQKTNSI